MTDLAQKIRDRLELPGAHEKPRAAIAAVLDVHPHRFMDTFVRETRDLSKAEYGACDTCGNVNEEGEVWCRTVRAVASALGVRVDGED